MSEWEIAVHAAQSRKAEGLTVLRIGTISSFTDFFVICTGTNSRQVQAIADAVETALKSEGVRPLGIEGYEAGEWILMDYGDFIMHVFSPRSREFYGLERLWKTAPRVPVPEAA
jgi:ribosome-associated protein